MHSECIVASSMHGDAGHEVRAELARAELARYELASARVARALHCLLSRELGELLRYQVMILSELLQQMVVRLLLQLLWLQCRVHLPLVSLLLRPCSGGLRSRV